MNVFVKGKDGRETVHGSVKVIDLTNKEYIEIHKDEYRKHGREKRHEVVKLNRDDVASIQYYVWMKPYTIKVSSRTRTKMVSEMPNGKVLTV